MLYYKVNMSLEETFNSMMVYWTNFGGSIKEKYRNNEEGSLVLFKTDISSRYKTYYFVKFRSMITDPNKTEVRIEIELKNDLYSNYDFAYYLPSRPINKWASIVGSPPDILGKKKFFIFIFSVIIGVPIGIIVSYLLITMFFMV